jgi:Sulfotransferase domain
MKLIGAGLPRTATTTQMFALERVGVCPCYHMRDVLGDLATQLPRWEAVADGAPDWDAIFPGTVSTLDWPSARFYPELMERYPEAKVLLSVRSAESWVRSMKQTVWALYFGDSAMRRLSDARAAVDPLWDRFLKLMVRITWADASGALAGDVESDAGLAASMERWNDEVRATVPADRLLVWDPAEGWEPMCELLGVAVPDEPLPHLNESEAFVDGIMGGGVEAINAWWLARERPASSLHGAEVGQ